MDIMDNHIFCLNDEILLAEFTDGGVAFNTHSRVCHELNRTGIRILSLLDGRRSVADVVELLAAKLDETKETITNDTENFLKDAIGRGWVHVNQR